MGAWSFVSIPRCSSVIFETIFLVLSKGQIDLPAVSAAVVFAVELSLLSVTSGLIVVEATVKKSTNSLNRIASVMVELDSKSITNVARVEVLLVSLNEKITVVVSLYVLRITKSRYFENNRITIQCYS